MLNRIKIAFGKFFVNQLERHGLTVVLIGSGRLKQGDWFSVKKIVRCPQDGSYRGDLFRVDKIEGVFAACTRFETCGGGRKQVFHLPDYELQTLTKQFVLKVRPEMREIITQEHEALAMTIALDHFQPATVSGFEASKVATLIAESEDRAVQKATRGLVEALKQIANYPEVFANGDYASGHDTARMGCAEIANDALSANTEKK